MFEFAHGAGTAHIEDFDTLLKVADARFILVEQLDALAGETARELGTSPLVLVEYVPADDQSTAIKTDEETR